MLKITNKPKQLEKFLQQLIKQYCDLEDIPFYCINNNVVPPVINGIYNREFAIRQAVKNKSMGVKKGVADAFIIINNKVCFIEFKSDKGKQKPEQIEFQEICKLNKIDYFVVRSLKEFEEILERDRLSSTLSSPLLNRAEISNNKDRL